VHGLYFGNEIKCDNRTVTILNDSPNFLLREGSYLEVIKNIGFKSEMKKKPLSERTKYCAMALQISLSY
jgi:hypothetical protein